MLLLTSINFIFKSSPPLGIWGEENNKFCGYKSKICPGGGFCLNLKTDYEDFIYNLNNKFYCHPKLNLRLSCPVTILNSSLLVSQVVGVYFSKNINFNCERLKYFNWDFCLKIRLCKKSITFTFGRQNNLIF